MINKLIYGFIILITAFVISFAPAIAETQLTPEGKKATEQITNYFSKIANYFGCTKILTADYSNPSRGLLEFIPPAETGTNWTKMVTVTVLLLPNKDAQTKEYMNKISSTFQTSFKKNAKVDFTKTLINQSGLPVTLMQYQIGEGIKKEYSMAIYGRFLPLVSAFVQIQSRGTPLSQTEETMTKKIANSLVKIK